MNRSTPTELQQLKRRRRWLMMAMRDQGVRRTSFMNGGLTDIEYRMNADMFSINTRIKTLEAHAK